MNEATELVPDEERLKALVQSKKTEIVRLGTEYQGKLFTLRTELKKLQDTCPHRTEVSVANTQSTYDCAVCGKRTF